MRSKYNLDVPSVPAFPKWEEDYERFREQMIGYMLEVREWLLALTAVLSDVIKDNAVDHDELDERLQGLGV